MDWWTNSRIAERPFPREGPDRSITLILYLPAFGSPVLLTMAGHNLWLVRDMVSGTRPTGNPTGWVDVTVRLVGPRLIKVGGALWWVPL